MDKSLDGLKDNLLKKRQELTKRISTYQKKAKDLTEFEGDDADRAFCAEDREMTFAMGSREIQEIKAIDNAIKSMNVGTYGICQECEKKIAKKRLKILPFTKHCMDCQAELELEKKQNHGFANR